HELQHHGTGAGGDAAGGHADHDAGIDVVILTEQVAGVILPDFSIFNVADTTSAGVCLSGGMLGSLALIAAGYMLLHLLVSTLVFSRKEF
ncbi:MAG: hypothetical protein IKK15_02650, partial [Akkermansia sp.]|nr:hypothetical protein [Akkermansia sp.]